MSSEGGLGFVLLRGIPVSRYTPEELRNLYWGLGATWAVPATRTRRAS